jgi:hypothetical protein
MIANSVLCLVIRRQAAWLVALLVAANALVGLVVAAPAGAGEFRVGSCQAAPLSYSVRPFEPFRTAGMWIKSACDPEGPGLRGLVTANFVRDGRVRRGERAIVTITAPYATRFTTFRWAGTIRRRDCGYAMALWADAPGVRPIPIKNVRANEGCPRAARAQGAAYRSRTFNVSGTTRIVQRIVCVGASRDRSCSARNYNFIRTYKAVVGIEDAFPPTVAVLGDGPLARGEWVRGNQALGYEANDNVGVRIARAVVGDQARASDIRSCVYADRQGTFGDRVPCPNGRGQMALNTEGDLSEGTQALVVQAEDAAGNVGASPATTVRVDNTPPGAVSTTVEGGDHWRNRNDFAVAWTNPPEGDRAPITAATYTICGSTGDACTRVTRESAGISRLAVQVPGPGEWTLALWRRDAAGNEAESNASVPVKLRYDPDPPELGFEQSPASDPTLISVAVNDKVSGMADGVIEISRQGSGAWQALPTDKHGSRLVARIDDAAMPAGSYELRARAVDQARNEGSTDRRLDGQPMVVTLPLRVASALDAGVLRTRVVRRTVRRGGTRRRVRRRVSVLAPTVRVGLGRQVQLTGALRSSAGQPLTGQQIQVFARSATAPEHLASVVQTDGMGRYSYVMSASSSQTLRLVYGGSAVVLPVQREVSVLVPAQTSFAVNRRRLLNGQRVVFTGQLRTLPPPLRPDGSRAKQVEVQVYVSRRWQTFLTPTTDAAGRWTVSYRFMRTRGLQRFRFRARVRAEAGYPFETGISRPLQVRVRGR